MAYSNSIKKIKEKYNYQISCINEKRNAHNLYVLLTPGWSEIQ